jgi:hypothetical protein
MHPDLDNLINIALADGEISDKERAIILRKAESLGEDKDEVEMILEGKLAQLKKQTRSSQESAGNIIKCPQCKADIPSFTTKCEFCGHEFRNLESSNSIKLFFEKLENLENTRESNGVLGSFAKFYGLGDSKLKSQKVELILSFPIPNSKEDILEFLALSVPRSKAPSMWGGGVDIQEKKETAKAFFQKCEQIIMKAGFSFKNDPTTLDEIKYYAKELGIKMR